MRVDLLKVLLMSIIMMNESSGVMASTMLIFFQETVETKRGATDHATFV